MSNPFASIETSINAAALSALGNATALVSGVAVGGMFDALYASPLGMSNSAPTFTALASDLDAVVSGDSIVISGTTYTVREIQPDGRGMIALVLETA
jgi:hypothetical protein